MKLECIWPNFLDALRSKVLIKVMIQVVPLKKRIKKKKKRQAVGVDDSYKQPSACTPQQPAAPGPADIPWLFSPSCITVQRAGVGFPEPWAGGWPCCRLWSCARADIQQTFVLQCQQLSGRKRLGGFAGSPSPRRSVLDAWICLVEVTAE